MKRTGTVIGTRMHHAIVMHEGADISSERCTCLYAEDSAYCDGVCFTQFPEDGYCQFRKLGGGEMILYHGSKAIVGSPEI